MKRITPSSAVLCFFALATLLAAGTAQVARAQNAGGQSSSNNAAAAPGGDSFVYADFENAGEGKRPVSSRGGLVQLISYQETTPSRFKGLANATPPAPEFVRLKADDPNHAVGFDYALFSPNQYAGVSVEVQGQPFKDGKPVADDLSAYKYLSMQIYATGVQSLRLEILSRGQGIALTSGFPQTSFKIKPGLNTYKIPLNSLTQPSWVDNRMSAKDVLKKLTGVSLTAYCERCTPVNGLVVVDNIIFQK